jgi:hypothetical protein
MSKKLVKDEVLTVECFPIETSLEKTPLKKDELE